MYGAEEAAEYDEMDFSASDQLFAERAAALAGTVRWIVDIGSGNGKIPLAMCSLLPTPVRVCAVEMSAEMLAVAARNRGQAGVTPLRLPLLNADAKLLPFGRGSVDMVTSNSLIHHIPQPLDVFREIARIVRPGAPILLRDLVRPQTGAEVEAILDKHAAGSSPLQRKLFSDSLRAALTVAEVRALLDACGLGDVAVSQISDRHWSAERS
jgi:ubiquinone/menaquinone biosynthesis C-methylase UbiE